MAFRWWLGVFLAVSSMVGAAFAQGFAVDTSPPPETHPALGPKEGAVSATNPPSLIWRHDATAASYTVEFSPVADFSRAVMRVPGVPMPFYNHDQPLTLGTWFWRYFVVRADGAVSAPGPVHSFRITADSAALPLPQPAALMAKLAPHPRIFATPATLEEFRSRRLGVGRAAWDDIRAKADALLALRPTLPALLPLPAEFPSHRQQVFYVTDGVARVPERYLIGELNRDADRANLLSLAWLISGDERYARAAREWALFVASFRVDFHLKTVAERGQHDSVVYAYEKGVTAMAFAYDRLGAFLTEPERRALLDHVEYHGEAAFHWLKEVMEVHLVYQESHAQQCMHALLPTALAIAGDSAAANAWLAYLVPQYVNRIAWMTEDGGYFEGQGYAFKFNYILEALLALRSATGVDLFQKPEIRNAADFWLYCMSLNYWWPHGGDTMPLVNAAGNIADAYTSALLAAATGNRATQWWSEAVPADPSHIPFSYLAATGLRPKPPVDVAQARAFVDTGQVSAYARFYDHAATRIFFRSSPWGGHSHAHADQNSFVLHAGGEILAADVGYYSYFGDDNYDHVSTQTVAHNAILVDGAGQSNDLAGQGAIKGFFNSPDYVFFAGDASGAYGPALDRYRRDVLYLRPDVFVVADELHAPKPSAWSWVLNTFAPPTLNEGTNEFTVAQRGERLWGRHVFPSSLHYTSSNHRNYPLLTREWARYTEAFPEPWRTQATTEKIPAADFLTVMHTFAATDGPRAAIARSLQSATTSAITLTTAGEREDILLRRHTDDLSPLASWDLQADARIFSARRDLAGDAARWLAVGARSASVAGREVLSAAGPLDIALTRGTAAAAVQIWTQSPRPTEVTVAVPTRPTRMVAFVPDRFGERGDEVAFRWAEGKLTFEAPEGARAFWVDPTVAATARPSAISLEWTAGAKSDAVELETTVAENGDWMAYAVVSPAAPGVYEFTSSDRATEFLVQDHWDPERSARGRGTVSGFVSGGTELILRFPPAATPPKFFARLVEPRAIGEINLIRNGDCEAGLPHYPPRGWTIRHGASGEFTTAGEQGFAEWTQEDAASGKGSLKFTRPLNRLADWKPPYRETARDTLEAAAPPVRLTSGGKYALRFKTRGTATHADLRVVAATGPARVFALEPSTAWREQRVELELPPGYTEVRIHFRAGGADDQVLWLDDLILAREGK